MKEKLYILWTNGDATTAESMLMMYATNAMKRNWWDEITVIIWGEPNHLIKDSEVIREKIKTAQEFGVKFSACKACAENVGTVDLLLELGVEVKYWGVGLTEILKDNERLLTI